MIREKISDRQLLRYYEKTEDVFPVSVNVSNPEFTHTVEFEACDSKWRVELQGTDFGTIGLNLTNLSSHPVRTKYEIVVKNQSTGDDHKWKDPDGLIVFSPFETVDDTWGTDDVISFRTLDNVTGLRVKDMAKFLVKISVFNTVDEVNEKRRHDLRIPPDANIAKLTKKGSYRAEFSQQDTLVSNRLQDLSSSSSYSLADL